MPVFNCNLYIKQAIKSILSQTYSNFEFIIIDSSNDDTSDIIKSFTDFRIIYHHIPNKCISEALNYGINIARGKYIARMDSDDISDITRIKSQIDFMNIHSNIDILGCNFFYINESGKVLYKKKMPRKHEDIEFMMPIQASLLHPTILASKKVFVDLQGYSSIYKTEDVEIFLRMIEKGFRMANIQLPLYYYRILPKDDNTLVSIKKSQLVLGKKFLENKYTGIIEKKVLYRKYLSLGLLEYYSGDMSNAKRYFLKCIFLNKVRFYKITRYFLISLLGNKFIKFLRKHKISNNTNILVNKIFNYEMKLSGKF